MFGGCDSGEQPGSGSRGRVEQEPRADLGRWHAPGGMAPESPGGPDEGPDRDSLRDPRSSGAETYRGLRRTSKPYLRGRLDWDGEGLGTPLSLRGLWTKEMESWVMPRRSLVPSILWICCPRS